MPTDSENIQSILNTVNDTIHGNAAIEALVESLSEAVAAIASSGSVMVGENPIQITIKDFSSAVVPYAYFVVSQNDLVVGVARSSIAGVATPGLAAGTYDVQVLPTAGHLWESVSVVIPDETTKIITALEDAAEPDPSWEYVQVNGRWVERRISS